MLGIHAALAAHKGLMAEENVLEMPRGFFSAYGGDHLEDVTKDLGRAWDITTDHGDQAGTRGHPHHAAAEAAANAGDRRTRRPGGRGRHQALIGQVPSLPGPRHPTDLIGVAHSPAYFIAAAVADRDYGWIHVSPVKVADPVIRQLIDKVTVNRTRHRTRTASRHHHGATVTIHAEGRPTVLCSRGLSARVRPPRNRMGRR